MALSSITSSQSTTIPLVEEIVAQINLFACFMQHYE